MGVGRTNITCGARIGVAQLYSSERCVDHRRCLSPLIALPGSIGEQIKRARLLTKIQTATDGQLLHHLVRAAAFEIAARQDLKRPVVTRLRRCFGSGLDGMDRIEEEPACRLATL